MTVEAAIALGTIAVFLALAIGAVAAVSSSIRCGDAARELARLAARGEPEHGRAVAAELAPSGAQLQLRREGDTIRVEVSVRLVSPLPITVGGRAVAAAEPSLG